MNINEIEDRILAWEVLVAKTEADYADAMRFLDRTLKKLIMESGRLEFWKGRLEESRTYKEAADKANRAKR